MKKNILTFLCLFGFLYTQAQSEIESDSTFVPFVAYWNNGDIYDFKITKIQKQWKNNELKKDNISTYIARFKVIDSTATSYKISWTYELNIPDLSIPEEYKSKDVSKLNQLEVIYTTDEKGTFVEIENWKEIGISLDVFFNNFIEYYSKSNGIINSDELKSTIAPITEFYKSKEGLETYIFKELTYFHYPLGIQIYADEPIEYEDELPNAFGEENILANSVISFEHVDFDEGFCIFTHKMIPDPESVKNMLRDVFNKLQVPNSSMQDFLDKSEYTITDNNVFEYFFDPGLPYKIEAHREIEFNLADSKGKRIDKTIIELIIEEEE